jgi:hypothetical protein
MKVQITEAAVLRRVSPTVLTAYLDTHGWTRQETWQNRIVVWSSEQDGRAWEVLAPLREQSDAYAVRISEILAVLAELEDRSQLDVYYDLIGSGADVIRFRSLNGFTQSDLSLDESVDLLTRARDLMMSAARAAERPGQRVYRGRVSGAVTDYVRGVRPLPGYGVGYELTLHSRVPTDYPIQGDFGDAVRRPFPRKATIALREGLREAEKAAAAVLGGASISAFEEAAPQGVSANLCEAVASLVSQAHGIEVSLSWAPSRPSDGAGGQFVFGESTADIFVNGADLLRKSSPFLDTQVTGEIVGLDRESREQFDGRAVLLSEIDGRPVGLRVQFEEKAYDEVFRAFRNGLEISVDGDIHREGNRHHLRNLSNFSVSG